MLSIDIVIPTFRRAEMVRRTLESIEACDAATGVDLGVIVVDNNSNDDTERVIREFAARSALRVVYVLETRPGRSSAVNAGVNRSSASHVAFVDDDERLFPDWVVAATDALRATGADFLGGAVVPEMPAELPPWIPKDWPGVLGDISGPTELLPFSRTGDAFFSGGNGLLRRDLFLGLGMYNPLLGRTGQERLMSCEDRDLFDRLLDSGARGYFVPTMKAWHHVPAERLTREYFRRWSFDHGASMTYYNRLRGARPARSFLGIEFWLWRLALIHAGRSMRFRASRTDTPESFSSELFVREFAGRLRGLLMPMPTRHSS